MRLDGIGHRAIADHERDRARLMSAAPLFDELAGGAVRRLELAHDGPVAREDRRAAEQRDRAAAAARHANPALALMLRIAAAEAERNTAMALLAELDGWLAERTDVPDADLVVREHSCGRGSARMYQFRDEAAELRRRVVADLQLVTKLNGMLAELFERRAA